MLLAQTTPLWATILVGVTSGVVAGFLGTWIRGRIEREETWRTRRFEAAYGFSAALLRAIMAAADVRGELRIADIGMPTTAAPSDEVVAAYLWELDKQGDDLYLHLGRVRMAFGDPSPVGDSAYAGLMTIRHLSRTIKAYIAQANAADDQEARRLTSEAAEHERQFNSLVVEALWPRPLLRRQWIRRESSFPPEQFGSVSNRAPGLRRLSP